MTPPPPPPPRDRSRTANRIALASLAVSLLAGVWTVIGPGVVHYWTDPVASIDSPVDRGTFNGPNVEVAGTAGRIPGDQDLWLVVRPEPDSPYYPVEQIAVQPDGTWKVPAQDVTLTPAGLYKLYVFVASSEATNSFQTYLKSVGKQAGTMGMNVLPPGATRLADRDVTRLQ